MKKNLPVQPALYPMPALMIGTYGPDGTPDLMMMAWGGICDTDKVALNLDATHKTVANLRQRKAFTLAVPDTDTLTASDYLGIVSANDVPDKVARSGLTAVPSKTVDAPVVEEYPLTLECEVLEFQDQSYGLRVLGKIVNILADDSVLTEEGKIDASKLNALTFDPFNNAYVVLGETVGKAWDAGTAFMGDEG